MPGCRGPVCDKHWMHLLEVLRHVCYQPCPKAIVTQCLLHSAVNRLHYWWRHRDRVALLSDHCCRDGPWEINGRLATAERGLSAARPTETSRLSITSGLSIAGCWICPLWSTTEDTDGAWCDVTDIHSLWDELDNCLRSVFTWLDGALATPKHFTSSRWPYRKQNSHFYLKFLHIYVVNNNNKLTYQNWPTIKWHTVKNLCQKNKNTAVWRLLQ